VNSAADAVTGNANADRDSAVTASSVNFLIVISISL
jgi:hypothetical protein